MLKGDERKLFLLYFSFFGFKIAINASFLVWYKGGVWMDYVYSISENLEEMDVYCV